MSKIPAPVSIPKPKSVTKTADAKTAEHGMLLQLAWEKLPLVADEFFGFGSNSEALANAKATAIAEFDRRIGEVSSALQRMNGSTTDQREVKALCRHLEALRKAATGVELPQTKTGVEHVVIEAPIAEAKEPAWGQKAKEKLVGFVDLSCTVQIRKELYLGFEDTDPISQALRGIASRFPFSDEPAQYAPALLKAYAGNPGPLPLPTWFTWTTDIPLWIDIRATATPVGQLLRELKTLRGYAPMQTEILVIADLDGRDSALQMLNDEGFHVGTRFWLEGLGG